MKNETTIAQLRQWHCPPWCPTTAQQHAGDSEALDNGGGGASHLLTTFAASDIDLPAVAAVVETDPRGQRKELVFIGMHDASPNEARHFALAVLRAADLAEMQKADTTE